MTVRDAGWLYTGVLLLFVAEIRNWSPFMNGSTELIVSVVDWVPLKFTESLISTKPEVPPGCRCQRRTGVGVPVADAVKFAVPPMLAVVLVGSVVMTGGAPIIVNVNVCDGDVPEPFVATTVNVNGEFSAESGVPLSTGEMNCMPAGNDGPNRLKVGAGAPEAWNVNVAGWFTANVAEVALVMTGDWGC